MAITYENNTACFDDAVSVEEAEGLLQWVQEHSKAKADFSSCTHVHASVLQVLMAARLCVTAWPEDDYLKTWLTAALGNRKEKRAWQKLS